MLLVHLDSKFTLLFLSVRLPRDTLIQDIVGGWIGLKFSSLTQGLTSKCWVERLVAIVAVSRIPTAGMFDPTLRVVAARLGVQRSSYPATGYKS